MADIKWSQFPSATPGDSDEVVGLHAGDNARFSVANFILAIRQGLANIFVPLTRKINNKPLSSDITLDASDVGAVDTADVGVADGVASLDNTGKVPSTQLPPISSDAEDITYDPTTSGLTATDVQAAIDEVVDDLDGKQSTITASGILKGDGAGGVSAATAGTDYQAPLTAGTDYATPAQLADKANPGQIGYPESGTTASRNYTAGEYICWNGLTYTADTNIALGTTLSASGGGKNLTECVGGGLNALGTNYVSVSVTKSSAITSGTITCYVKAGWCFIEGKNVIFASSGNSKMGVVTGIPKALAQANFPFAGSTYTNTAAIRTAGDCGWIDTNGTQINVHLGSTYNLGHWFSVAYPVA